MPTFSRTLVIQLAYHEHSDHYFCEYIEPSTGYVIISVLLSENVCKRLSEELNLFIKQN